MTPTDHCRPLTNSLELHRSLRSPADPYGVLRAFTTSMETCGALWTPMDLYGSLRSPLGPYGDLGTPMDPDGPYEASGTCGSL